MNILVIDDDRWMVQFFKEIIADLLLDMRREYVIKEVTSLSGARTLLVEGFVPDFAVVDYDLGPVERGTTIFQPIREKNPQAFICLVSIREKIPVQSADLLVMKRDFGDELPDILHRVIFKKR